jgi:alternate signal-mediated exported protein
MASKNKMFKGAVAGATGVALLAGGFGSFALFTNTEALPSGSLVTGVLTSAAGTTTYADRSPDATSATWDPATDEMVPGDVIEVAVPLTVTAKGKNLKGKVAFDGSAVSLTDPALNNKLSLNYDIVPADNDTVTAGQQTEVGVTYTAKDTPVSFVETADGDFVVTGIATFTLSSTANQAETDAANVAIRDTAFTVNQDARS